MKIDKTKVTNKNMVTSYNIKFNLWLFIQINFKQQEVQKLRGTWRLDP